MYTYYLHRSVCMYLCVSYLQPPPEMSDCAFSMTPVIMTSVVIVPVQ